jgi:DNA-directed RNA polymerase II subunit RPB7
MPEEIKYDANATPPQFTNNADWVIEPGTHARVKIIGTRTEVGEMWAIGSINGDFLGYAPRQIIIWFVCSSLIKCDRCLQA